jgi:peptidyl-prolyl cis-trans isomerase SurA
MIFIMKQSKTTTSKFIKSLICSVITLFALSVSAQPQKKLIDQVIAVVGNNIILQSDLENQYFQMLQQGGEENENSRCELLEELLFQKLLLHQAKLDSVKINDSQVESEMDRRMRYFIQQIGSEEKLEEYYGKSINAIKDEFREIIRDQLLIQQVQQKITGNITVTPAEVKSFFNKIPKDSLPFVNSELEVAQIVAYPKISNEAKDEARTKSEELRARVVKGESFSTLAVLYSEDPGSAKRGGELGFVERGVFVPEFEAVAFRLKIGQISEIVETTFGYHFMELIERRGERINIRHILITPKVGQDDLKKARHYIDSIRTLIINTDTLNFNEAAALFSDDKDTKYNGGLLVNPVNGTNRFEADQLDPSVFFTVDKMKVGEISQPVAYQMPGGKQAFRILYLKTRTEPHRANLKDDYQRIQDAALNDKQDKIIAKWIDKKMSTTYFKISDDYKSCNMENFRVQAP